MIRDADIVTVVQHRRLLWAGNVMKGDGNSPIMRALNENLLDGKWPQDK